MKKLILLLTLIMFSIAAISQENYLSKITAFSNIHQSKSLLFKSHQNLLIPTVFISYGFSSLGNTEFKEWNHQIRAEILEDHPGFKTSIDNYLQFYPAAATFSLKMIGLKGQNDLWSSAKIYATSTLLMAGTVYALKSMTGELRPDGSGNNSFPSGHTATAFAAAEFMHQEFKNASPLLSYSGYLAAAATGTLRMYNNKHYLSDVIAGAGLGILTTKAAYWLNDKVLKSYSKKHSTNF